MKPSYIVWRSMLVLCLLVCPMPGYRSTHSRDCFCVTTCHIILCIRANCEKQREQRRQKLWSPQNKFSYQSIAVRKKCYMSKAVIAIMIHQKKRLKGNERDGVFFYHSTVWTHRIWFKSEFLWNFGWFKKCPLIVCPLSFHFIILHFYSMSYLIVDSVMLFYFFAVSTE